MADRYTYARRRTALKLAQWNTGAVTLTRTTRAASNPSTPHIPGEVTAVDVYSLAARVDGVTADYIDGATIIATDLMVIASPKATLDDVTVDVVPQMSDVLAIDGAEKTIKKIEPVPAAGPAARFHIFVAS